MSGSNGAMEEREGFHKVKDLIGGQERRLDGLERLLTDVAKNTAPILQVTEELKFLRSDLLQFASKNDHIPMQVFDRTVEKMSSVYGGVMKALCICLVTIVAWLTGVKEIPKIFAPAVADVVKGE